MCAILVDASPRTAEVSPWNVCVNRGKSGTWRGFFELLATGLGTDADQKGFSRLVARGLGLDRLDHPEAVLEQLDELTVAAAVEDLADQRTIGLEVAQTEVHRQFDQVGDA